ncbi:calcium-binding protein [Phaeovulum vinaykumarii]|nr:hypothetical protein [Phaeovulum vinaykumarii]
MASNGDDTITGTAGADTVDLGDGNDSFGSWITDTGDDLIFGGTGDDTIRVTDTDGFGVLAGDSGTDRLEFVSNATTAGTYIHYTGGGTLDYFEFGTLTERGTAQGIENITGTDHYDWIDATSNTLTASYDGGAGGDTTHGGAGAETLRGGDDSL